MTMRTMLLLLLLTAFGCAGATTEPRLPPPIQPLALLPAVSAAPLGIFAALAEGELAPGEFGGQYVVVARYPAVTETAAKADRVCFVVTPGNTEVCNTAPWPAPNSIMSLGTGADQRRYQLTPAANEVAGAFLTFAPGARYEVRAYAANADGRSELTATRYVVDRTAPPAPKPPGVPELLKMVRQGMTALRDDTDALREQADALSRTVEALEAELARPRDPAPMQ